MNVEKIREDFQVLKKEIIYLDSACMSLKPIQVVDKINEYYNEYPSCAGRSVHKMGLKLDKELDDSRKSIQKFVGAKKSSEIIFSKNASESINLIANSFKFDKVLLTDREHNSNLLPWQKFKYGILRSKEDFTFDLEKFSEAVKKYDLVSFVYTSNIDGYTLPVKEIIKIAHDNKAKVHFDAAQAAPHKEINVKKLDVDFLTFSGHKMLGPTGTGAMFVKEKILDEMKPFLIGGETVVDSNYDSYVLEKLPQRFEAGLQNYAGILGFGEAAKYLGKIGMSDIEDHEKKLVSAVDVKVKEVGFKGERGIFNFNLSGIDHHEVAGILDSSKNIMVRSGMHCAHSWYNAKQLKGSVRASFYLYNTLEEVKIFNEELEKIRKLK
ncbi:aminotransferase class V-fold PLP-dependent enzyme [Candidatus Woesearchaeota archaeon]|jgi:cysteine desulfurase / selenocysteine lyase|nr:aminotransferase class V-fold PLP-dependent enzyme [Candidatus Woesearchaeota archaeon]MBT4321656.1 aminotransferase class V-fold PLP-dependent enzyme [Candidatus Woesearchaeota archaeon]MBT4631033.1 aminotransferase class V-fold PLP-dependent enzyme [Candidatus Woesearchaeota archaeon]